MFESLKTKAQNWALSVVELYKTPVPQDMLPWKNKLLALARTIKNTVEAVTGAIPELQVIDSATNLKGVPLVLGIGGLSAAAAIGYWYWDYKKFKAELDARTQSEKIYLELVKSGVSPAQAQKVLNRPIKIDSKMLILLGLVGAGGYAAYRFKLLRF